MVNTLTSRRFFLTAGLLAGGGLVLGMKLKPQANTPTTLDNASRVFVPNAFVQIDLRGHITLIMPHAEFGQGIFTSSAMLMAEELEVGLDQVQVMAAPPDLSKYIDPQLFDQATGGSTSTRSDWKRLREAAAAARTMLVAVAADRWSVTAASCHVERGVIRHGASGRTLAYGDVARDAANRPVPGEIRLKDRSDFKLIGTSAKRIDGPAKVNGTAVYGIDVKVSGMRVGTLAITPAQGGRLASVDLDAAMRVPGVRDVIRSADGCVVAVIGDHMWSAKTGLEALQIVWEAGPNSVLTVDDIVAEMERASKTQGVVARKKADAAKAIAGAATRLAATYQSPFLSHSPMEPLNCTLHIQPDKAEIWVGTQVPVRAQKAVAEATGLPPEKVIVNNMLMGGGFGRGLEITSIVIATSIAKQLSYPVKLVWTREEDMRHDNYRPYYFDRVAAGLDRAGNLVGRTHRVTGPSLYARWSPGAFKDGLDVDAVDCAAETPYDIAAEYVDYVRYEPSGISTSWWRGVGPTHNLFVLESFIDELAVAGKRDPVEFRRSMLRNNPRALQVLDVATEKAAWGAKIPRRVGRGISVQFAFGTYLANVTEVEVSTTGEIHLRRVVVALDCGTVINPDTVRAQIEGGVVFGLGAALFNEITLTGGAVNQSNFDTYRTLRINEMPKIEVYLEHNDYDPGGVGEAGTASAAPALANAIFAATGRRLRRLPIARQLST